MRLGRGRNTIRPRLGGLHVLMRVAPSPAEAAPGLSMTDLSDAELMTRIGSHDADALAALYDRHAPAVFAFCRRALKDHPEAEDLTLDIFWEIWDRHDRYDADRAPPLTYLMRVTRSRIIDRLRGKRARSITEAADAAPSENGAFDAVAHDGAPSPLDSAALAEQRLRIIQAMRQLTPPQRAVVELAFFEALSHSEIAERLGEPLGTVKSRIRQALARLRQDLNLMQARIV